MIGYGNSATNHDFFCFNAANQVWNGSAFVNWADTDYVSYRVAATPQGTSGRFTGVAPSGTERYELRERGASLALSYVVWESGLSDAILADTTEALTRLLTVDQLTAMVAILGIPSSGSTPETPSLGVLKAIYDKSQTITPYNVYAVNTITGSGINYNIEAFVGETNPKTIPSPDYSAVAMHVVFQDIDRDTDVAILENASITKTSSSVSFAMPSKVRAREKTYRYAVRRDSDGEVLLYGTWKVLLAAKRS